MNEVLKEIISRSVPNELNEEIDNRDIIKLKNELRDYSFKVKALYEEGNKLIKEISNYRTANLEFAFRKRNDIVKAIVKLDHIALTLKQSAMTSNIIKDYKKI